MTPGLVRRIQAELSSRRNRHCVYSASFPWSALPLPCVSSCLPPHVASQITRGQASYFSVERALSGRGYPLRPPRNSLYLLLLRGPRAPRQHETHIWHMDLSLLMGLVRHKRNRQGSWTP